MKKNILAALFVSLSCFGASHANLSEKQVGQLATAYFKAHPEKMLEVMQSVQEALKEQQFNGVKRQVIKNREFLLNNPNLPVMGNPKAKQTLVFFFDYQCAYCHQEYPVLKRLVSSNQDLRVVFVPLHLFGSASLYASKLALYSNSIGDFQRFNDALQKADLIEGKLTDQAANQIAQRLGISLSKAKEYINGQESNAFIEKIDQLQNNLGIQGTPMMFIVPQGKNIELSDIHVVQGYVSEDRIKGLL